MKVTQIEPLFDELELLEITEVIQSTYITEHKKTEEFLARIKSITGATYALSLIHISEPTRPY